MTDNKTASEHIYAEIRSMIERGELKPGMRLIQRDLAKRLNTSNIPIVEAIRRLEHDGLVLSRANCGAQVMDWSIDEIESAIMIRSSLEQIAARLCAVRASDEQRAKIKELAAKYVECASAQDYEGCKRTDAALHTYIIKCSGSRLLARMLGNSRVITNTIGNVTWLPLTALQPDVHDSLVDAIVSGDEGLAEAEAKTHIDKVLSVLHEAIKARGLRQ